MQREIDGWHSPRLDKHMEIATYGHYGFALLLVPTAAADYLEYERFHLIKSIEKQINDGKVKVFSINSINTESWMNKQMQPHHKGIRQNQFNAYVYDEVVPYIRSKTSDDTPIITCGASFGALHSMNLFLKRPDIIKGVIAMSGCYDLTSYTDGFFNDDVFFNSPEHYMPGLTEDWYLSRIRNAQKILISAGSGAYEKPELSRRFSTILAQKDIGHELDIWGYDMPHDWDTWRKMLPHYLETRF